MVERTDYIAEAIAEAFGGRCPDFAEGCACCEAWQQYDRLREVERRGKELANSFYVFTIEDDDGIRLSTGGMVVAHYSEHSPEGIALLKLDAASRALSEREGQE